MREEAQSLWEKPQVECSLRLETSLGAGDVGSLPGSGRYSGVGHGNPLQHSCLENPMGRETWAATHTHPPTVAQGNWHPSQWPWMGPPIQGEPEAVPPWGQGKEILPPCFSQTREPFALPWTTWERKFLLPVGSPQLGEISWTDWKKQRHTKNESFKIEVLHHVGPPLWGVVTQTRGKEKMVSAIMCLNCRT